MAGLGAAERESEPLVLFDEEEVEIRPEDESSGSPPPVQVQERLGGARADFVANLGRRVQELSSLMRRLEKEPDSELFRDDLRRRLHALAAGARLLRFGKLAEELGACEALLTRAAEHGAITESDAATLYAVIEGVPALAWGEASVRESTPSPPRVGPASSKSGVRAAPSAAALLDPVRVPLGACAADEPAPRAPQTVLVVGPPQLADALQPAGADASGIEVERTEDNTGAIDLARALAPDVLVLDADRSGARELCAALLYDPLTEVIPIVVVGRWQRLEEAAPFVTMGAARALVKPVSPDALRRACLDVAARHATRDAPSSPLGDVSLDELGARLSAELRRGLCEAALAQGRGARFDLGEGSEVLAALWGAVARIRDLVTIQSSGEVRFSPSGPEGAMPIAPWLGSPAVSGGDRRARQPIDARAGVSPLDRKVVVVADDDPAVTWFLAGVLRSSGAIVHEAHDGARALEIAFRVTPDLVVSDVLMPILDGFALCRALKRDLVLSDVPVILLSWKEDLLQRVRELGADADGYIRKEASAASIVQRVREVMRGRQRVAERLATGGEVRGRLDGLTTRTLLGLACAVRPDSLVSVRDAAFLYEIEIRDGQPARASRTAADNSFERGPEVLSALLGVGSGRFVVTPAPAEMMDPELEGSLEEQLLPRIASSRAAQRLLSGTALASVERVELAEARMAAYAVATPEPARSLLRTLAAGASPRALITSGQAAPRLVEDVLCDAAAHGAVLAIVGAGGEELLAAAAEREAENLRGARVPRGPLPEPVLDLGPVIHTSTPAPVALLDGYVDVEEHEEPANAPVEAPPVLHAEAPPVLHAEPDPALDESLALARNKPLVTLGSLTPPPVQPQKIVPKAPPIPRIAPLEDTPSRSVRGPSSFVTPDLPAPPAPARKEPAKHNRSMWALFAVAGIVFAVGARMSRDRDDAAHALAPAADPKPAETAAPAAPPAAEAPAPPAGDATPSADAKPAEPKAEGETKGNPILPQETALRADDKVPPGQGMLEIVAGTSDTIYIDGTLVGNGPIVKRALAPKKEPYEIRVKLRGEDRVRFVLVKEARLTRLRIAPPWSR